MPQQHKREVQQSREQVLHPHGGQAAEKARRRLCSGRTRFEKASAHPLRWQLPAIVPSPAPRPPARLRDPQHPRESTSLSVPLSAQTPPGTSLPHSLCRSRHTELPLPEGFPPPPPSADYNSQQPPRLHQRPHPHASSAVHAGTCSPRRPSLRKHGEARPPRAL